MRAQGGAITPGPSTYSLDIEKVLDHYEAYGHDRTREKKKCVVVIGTFEITIKCVLAWLECIQWK